MNRHIINQWIESSAKFTVKSLENWLGTPDTARHLLAFWTYESAELQRKDLENSSREVNSAMVDVIKAYVESRMSASDYMRSGMIDDSLDDENRVLNEADMFARVFRTYRNFGPPILKQCIDSPRTDNLCVKTGHKYQSCLPLLDY